MTKSKARKERAAAARAAKLSPTKKAFVPGSLRDKTPAERAQMATKAAAKRKENLEKLKQRIAAGKVTPKIAAKITKLKNRPKADDPRRIVWDRVHRDNEHAIDAPTKGKSAIAAFKADSRYARIEGFDQLAPETLAHLRALKNPPAPADDRRDAWYWVHSKNQRASKSKTAADNKKAANAATKSTALKSLSQARTNAKNAATADVLDEILNEMVKDRRSVNKPIDDSQDKSVTEILKTGTRKEVLAFYKDNCSFANEKGFQYLFKATILHLQSLKHAPKDKRFKAWHFVNGTSA